MQIRRHSHELSGGMRQRVMIAMGLMRDVKLLIADEPTTALDVTIQAQIMDLLAKINKGHQMAVIFISHNLALVKQNCSRVIVMYAGRIVEELPVESLTVDPQHPYTKSLLAAVPDLSRSDDAPLQFIPGEAPDPGSPPGGCPFHPRCPVALGRCSTDLPPLMRRAGGRAAACWVANADLL
jgi:oligopeptide/dipeptide ABC transporter ATP-binding protein